MTIGRERERVYPYEGEPDTTVARAERRVFDIVAVTATKLIPNFQDSELKLKRFQLRMLRQAIEHGPRELREILTQVLDLPFRRQEELARLLERTSLSSIISASKLVADRLRFIKGLDQMLFRPDLKSDFNERSQLHRLLAEGNTWLFGEEFTLTVDGQGLTELLRQHLKELGHHAVVDERVRRLDGSVGIIDLMLTRRVPGPREMEREHVVIELKAPTVALGSKEITQIKSYAFAVAADPRFRDITTRWSFWLVGGDTDAYTNQELRRYSRTSPGLPWMDDERPSMRIWVKTWGQLLAESRARLTFFQKELNYSLDRDESLEFLRETYAKFLSAASEDDEDAGQSEAGRPTVSSTAASD